MSTRVPGGDYAYRHSNPPPRPRAAPERPAPPAGARCGVRAAPSAAAAGYASAAARLSAARVGAEHREGTVVSSTAKHVGGGQAGAAASDDDDGRGRACHARGARARGVHRQLLSDVRLVANPLDTPAGNRIEGRRAERLTGSQAEAGMVPRASHRVADDQAFDEWAVIVSAGRADGEEAITLAHQDRLLLADASEDLAAVRKLLQRETLGEIRLRNVSRVCHRCPPGTPARASRGNPDTLESTTCCKYRA